MMKSVATTAALVLLSGAGLGLFAARWVAPTLLQVSVVTITTGSMAPTMPAGSMAYIERAEGPFAVGDVLTFQRGTERFTHRAVEVVPDGSGSNWYVTKGDHNETDDAQPVHDRQVEGRVVWSAPWLGVASVALDQPAVIAFVLLVATTILFWPLLAGPGEDQWEAAAAKRGAR